MAADDDVLAKLSPPDVAAFYARLADSVEANRGALQSSLAALLMRKWLENRSRGATLQIDVPPHVKTHADVMETLRYHRRVFLTQEQAKTKKWAGIVPRLLGQPGFQKWDGLSTLKLEYESLVEIPMWKQVTGSDADRDILYSLHGFQLKSTVSVGGQMSADRLSCAIRFVSYEASISDTYDWDYSEHLKVPNPDFGKKGPGAVEPGSKVVRVYHSNAKRIEDANLAAPYSFTTPRWPVSAPDVTGTANVSLKMPR